MEKVINTAGQRFSLTDGYKHMESSSKSMSRSAMNGVTNMNEINIEDLTEGLMQEIIRTKVVLGMYELVPPSGIFFASNIYHEITMAEYALESGNIEDMLTSYTHLNAIE